jgi:mannose-6-phosphate isomerase-like protein (cupin superfamily)
MAMLKRFRAAKLSGSYLKKRKIAWENWEMHPEGDEIVYVLNGKARMIFDLGDEIEQSVDVQGGSAVIVPKGIWHTANIKIVTRMLHITMGKGTVHRPRKKV